MRGRSPAARGAFDARRDVDADGGGHPKRMPRRSPDRGRRRATTGEPRAQPRRPSAGRPADPSRLGAARRRCRAGCARRRRRGSRRHAHRLVPGGAGRGCRKRLPIVQNRSCGGRGLAPAAGGAPSTPAGPSFAMSEIGSSPLSWIASASRAAAIAWRSSADRSTVIGTIAGRGPSARSREQCAASATASSSVQCARRAGDEVEPDRIRAGADRGLDAGGVGDAADLDERGARRLDRIVGGLAGGNERAGGRGRIARANERLADERRIETERPPAPDASRRRGRRTRRWRVGRRGSARASALARSGSTSSVRRSRLLMPITRAGVASAASISRSSWASTSGSSPRSRRSVDEARRATGAGGGSPGGGPRRRPRPAARSSWRRSTTNSFARTGTLIVARTAPGPRRSRRTSAARRARRSPPRRRPGRRAPERRCRRRRRRSARPTASGA